MTGMAVANTRHKAISNISFLLISFCDAISVIRCVLVALTRFDREASADKNVDLDACSHMADD